MLRLCTKKCGAKGGGNDSARLGRARQETSIAEHMRSKKWHRLISHSNICNSLPQPNIMRRRFKTEESETEDIESISGTDEKRFCGQRYRLLFFALGSMICVCCSFVLYGGGGTFVIIFLLFHSHSLDFFNSSVKTATKCAAKVCFTLKVH